MKDPITGIEVRETDNSPKDGDNPNGKPDQSAKPIELGSDGLPIKEA